MARDNDRVPLEPEPKATDESEETLEQPTSRTHRRRTLTQRAEDDNESTTLTRTIFEELLQDPDKLYKDVQALIKRVKELRAYNENYCEQLQEMKQAVRRNEVVIERLATQGAPSLSLSPAPEVTRRTTKLPDPPLFDGSNRSGASYDNWLIQLKNKLRGNHDAYPTDDLQIIYAASRISGDALALISPRLNTANRHAYETVEELYTHLDELYGDPNKERNARYAFKELSMKKGQTFQEFYAAFLRYIADGNISSSNLKDELNDKLTWKLQEAVATYYNDPAVTLSRFAQHCTTNDQQIRARFEKRERAARKPEEARKASTGQDQPPRAIRADNDRTTLHQQPTTRPELKCYNCFEPGHMSRDCSKPKTERTKQALAAKLATVSPSSSVESESENE